MQNQSTTITGNISLYGVEYSTSVELHHVLLTIKLGLLVLCVMKVIRRYSMVRVRQSAVAIQTAVDGNWMRFCCFKL